MYSAIRLFLLLSETEGRHELVPPDVFAEAEKYAKVDTKDDPKSIDSLAPT